MAKRRVLITGGAGFIGSHLADHLLAHGHAVRALDSLSPQVHGPEGRRPAYLDPEVELQVGDVRDPEAVRRALQGVDAVVHLAAAVGVGQSMLPMERLVVASSMSLYGEGLHRDRQGREVQAELEARGLSL